MFLLVLKTLFFPQFSEWIDGAFVLLGNLDI